MYVACGYHLSADCLYYPVTLCKASDGGNRDSGAVWRNVHVAILPTIRIMIQNSCFNHTDLLKMPTLIYWDNCDQKQRKKITLADELLVDYIMVILSFN
jgi:hypothetical protein